MAGGAIVVYENGWLGVLLKQWEQSVSHHYNRSQGYEFY